MRKKIPKKIHYCWFGKGEMSPLHHACMKTWTKYLQDYEIICWNEENSPMNHPFVNYHYKKRNWAFVSDYVRLYAIYKHGGIYLDVDFEILKKIDELRDNSCFLGYELPKRVTNGICGGEKGHYFFWEAMQFMENRHQKHQAIMTSPEVCTKVYSSLVDKNRASDIKIYSQEYFYPYNPFDQDLEKHFLLADYITNNTFAIHHWGHSWKQSLPKRILRKIHKLIYG